MNQFPDKLLFSEAGYKDDSLLIRIEQDFRYISSKGTITVLKDFISDGASIPKVFHGLMGPFGRWFRASLIHDVLYQKNCGYDFDRKTCDLIFLEAMEICGVPFIKRQTIFLSVRMFGWKFFRVK